MLAYAVECLVERINSSIVMGKAVSEVKALLLFLISRMLLNAVLMYGKCCEDCKETEASFDVLMH